MHEPETATLGAGSPAATQTLRLFVALTLPAPVLEELSRLARGLQTGIQFTGAQPRWCDPAAFHMTLAFLGNQPFENLTALTGAVSSLGAEFPPQRLEIRKLGVFPHWQRPRVLWAGIRDRSHSLDRLHTTLHERLAPFGYEPEKQKFRPHITLARFKDARALPAIERIVHDHDGFCFGPFETASLVLFQSVPGPAGARHEPLHVETLRGPLKTKETIPQ